jgi:hypothetical protein
VILLKTSRLDYGLHPFFYSIKDSFRDILLVAFDFDPSVYFTALKMSRIKGITPKIKLTPHLSKNNIVFLKVYGSKVVQSFYMEFSSGSTASLFIQACKVKFPNFAIYNVYTLANKMSLPPFFFRSNTNSANYKIYMNNLSR